MKRLLYILLLWGLSGGMVYGQAQMNLNGAYMVNNASYVVVDNTNSNALISTNSGWIIPKSEFSMLVWNIGTGTGTYTVPFGDTTLDYLPVSLDISTAGVGSGSVKFSTFHTPALNSTDEPSDVTNLTPFILPGSPSNTDNSYNIADRFYILDANTGYTTKPTIANLTLPYVSGTAQTEVGSPNTLSESRLMAQRFNSSTGTWTDWFGEGCTDNITGNVGTVETGTLAPADFYRSWSLWDHTMPLPLKIAGTNPSCGGLGGSATVSVYGGVSPYTYSWSPNGGSSSIANGLTAGTYTVSVNDSHGCISTISVTITSPAPIVVTTTVTTQVDCHGNADGSGAASATGGTGAYTYSWSPSGGSASSASALTADVYTVTVNDANGCVGTASLNITQPTQLTTTATVTNEVHCKGGNDGNATANPTGGTMPYSYSWSNGTSTVSTSNPTGSTLSAGSYTVTVTDANNCTATASIAITEANTITVRFWSVTDVNCRGDSNGTATTSVTGGTPPYTYTWSSTPSSTVMTNSNHGTAIDLKGGYTYSVVVTDANGCEGTARTTITQPATSVTETVTLVSPPTCHGYSNAIATTRGSGGTPPYKYVWSDGGETTQTATGLVATAVSCQIIDSRGCTDLQTINITQPSVIAGSFSNKIEPHCYGNLNGSMTVTASGGNGVYTYAWSPSGETTAVASNISGATYTVTIQDQNGCTGSAIATLNQPAVLGNSITRATCVSGKATLSVHPTGGTSPYTYAWSTGATLAAINEPPGTYSVSVTDVNHCNVGTSFTFTTCPEIKPRGEDTAQGPDNGASGYTDIKVYPNPTNGEFTIAGIEQGMIIEMYDFIGRKISTLTASELTMQLNISGQPNGIYLIRILDKDGNLITNKKLVKTY